jgi:Mg-chelatase subunit ChlD
MSRLINNQKSFFVTLTLATLAAAWWGCAAAETEPNPGATTSQSSSSGSSSTTTGGAGGINVDTDGGMDEDSGACASISAAAERVQLDMIFLIDRSGSMSGPKWTGTKSALSKFFNDPASNKIGVGLSYFPNYKAEPCIPEDYYTLNVPIDTLPDNTFALTNSMPADATGGTTPTWGALKGALAAATAYQDAHPTHKVILVLATDGDPNGCGATTIDDIAALAKSARAYNGVLTYVIGVAGSTIANLNKIAAAGGTTAAYDVTLDINEFAAKIEEIRGASLGCEFEIPPPPGGEDLDPDKVNFSYTPKGVGEAKLLLRADDLADCNGKPGWYYDNNDKPTKILLCPASCATVQADTQAEVEALFGCKSQLN